MKKVYTILFVLVAAKLFAQPVCNWAYMPIGTNANNTVYNAVVDASGNIFQAGSIVGIADMHPGSGTTDTSFSFIGYNFYLAKYTSTGNLLWIKYFESHGAFLFFDFTGLAINSNNEIIVTGNYFGTVDFDLSATGIDTISSHQPTYPDYFVAKYDAQGNYNWAFSIGAPQLNRIESHTITLLPNDDIVVAATPHGSVDVDPGPAVQNCLTGNADLICYDTNGNYLWDTNNFPANYSYAQYDKTIDCDVFGNIYLMTVGYYELTVTKFSNAGTKLWEHKIGEFSSLARVTPQSILVDKATGDFYVAGTFGDTVDFDPGVNVENKISSSWNYEDGFIAKYDANMNLIWVNHYAGEVEFGKYSLDFSGNDIVAVGRLSGSINFGNGVTLISSAPTVFSPFYVKLNAGGVVQNGYAISGSGFYLTINSIGNQMYATSGFIATNTDMDPGNATLLIQGNSNGFTAVYTTTPTAVTEIENENTFTVFPNPSTGFIVVETKINSLIELLDVSGKKVLSQRINANAKNVLDVSEIASGLYFLKTGNQIQKINILHEANF